MLDDTWCFVPCDSGMQACVLACLLNQPSCIEFIHALVFMDSKRPVTKRILRRRDVSVLMRSVDKAKLAASAERANALAGFPPIESVVKRPFAAIRAIGLREPVGVGDT